jgi:hypothetical protein
MTMSRLSTMILPQAQFGKVRQATQEEVDALKATVAAKGSRALGSFTTSTVATHMRPDNTITHQFSSSISIFRRIESFLDEKKAKKMLLAMIKPEILASQAQYFFIVHPNTESEAQSYRDNMDAKLQKTRRFNHKFQQPDQKTQGQMTPLDDRHVLAILKIKPPSSPFQLF